MTAHNKKRTLMILGAGIYQLPAIRKAKALGIEVITVDYLPNNIGHKYSDIYEDISTIEAEKVLSAARKHKIDGIMTIASDIAVPTVAYVAKNLNLPSAGVEQASIISNKARFKSFLKQRGFAVPDFRECKNIGELIRYIDKTGLPILIKPVDRSGSKAIYRIDTTEGIEGKFKESKAASFKKSVCAEKILKGTEIGCETFCFDGNPEFINFTNKYLKGHIVNGHSLPCSLPRKKLEKIKKRVSDVIKALGIKWGPVNLDVMICGDNIYILDIGARLGGNCLPKIIYMSTGVDTVKLSIEVALGKRLEIPTEIRKDAYAVRIIGSPRDGMLKNHADIKNIIEKYPDILEIVIDRKPGEKVTAFNEGKNRVGHIITKGGNVKEAESNLILAERALNLRYSK